MRGLVAVVTGGAGGIGQATCELLGRRDATVIVTDYSEGAASNVASVIVSTGGVAESMFLDVGEEVQVSRAVATIRRDYGHIDILVNAAGVAGLVSSVDLSLAEWRRVLDVNLLGTFLVCREVGAVMLGQGAGSIVNVASTAGLTGASRMAHYSASKHGVIGLTRSLAVEWGPFGVRVNCVCPGPTETALLRNVMGSEFVAAAAARVPLRRIGTARDQAESIAFLSSSAAQFITGSVISVDGGISALSSSALQVGGE